MNTEKMCLNSTEIRNYYWQATLLLQYIKENLVGENVLYVSLDNMWFISHSLMDLVEYHYINGGTHLFLDEVHKYPHWQTYIKNI